MSAIVVENLKKYFNGIKAVDGVSFEVEEGEIFALLGPNGAGKTTTVRLLTCQIKPTEGKASVFGYDIVKEGNKIRKLIGIVPQERALNELLTAEQNLYFYGMLYDLPKRQIKRKIDELLPIMGLEYRRKELVKNFSGGMKQRLSIILALLHEPKLLFLDEPTTGLDPQARRHIWKFIREINDKGTTVFLTTHYMEEADNLCNRVAIIDNGKIIALDKPSNLKRKLEREKIVEIEVDIETDAEKKLLEKLKGIEGIKHLNYSNGILKLFVEDRKGLLLDVIKTLSEKNIKAMATVEPTLEDVFISLTGKRLRD